MAKKKQSKVMASRARGKALAEEALSAFAEEQQKAKSSRRRKFKSKLTPSTGDVITVAKVHALFDRYAVQVLIGDYLDNAPAPPSEGKRRVRHNYRVKKILPSKEHYEELKQIKYARTLQELVGEAFSEADSLKDELQDWYDNLPESFQSGEKGDRLNDAIGYLEQLSEPVVPTWTEDAKILYLPSLAKKQSRADRAAEAVGKLNVVIEKLEELIAERAAVRDLATTKEKKAEALDREVDELEDLRHDLETAVSDLESVEFPSMYG